MYSVGIGIKQSEREANHLPQFIAEIKHDQCHNYTPQYACMLCAATTLLLGFTEHSQPPFLYEGKNELE